MYNNNENFDEFNNFRKMEQFCTLSDKSVLDLCRKIINGNFTDHDKLHNLHTLVFSYLYSNKNKKVRKGVDY